MTIALGTGQRNNMLDDLKARLEAGPGNAILTIYSGVRPAFGVAGVQLVTMEFDSPAYGIVASGNMPLTGPLAGVALATGTATWFRVTDSNGVAAVDGDVGKTGSGADLELNRTNIIATAAVSVTQLTIWSANP